MPPMGDKEMPDIIASGDWGRDDGIKCKCGGKTYLVDDQGYGLCGYECESCGDNFQVQYEWDDSEEEYDESG